jgi:prepilin-type N-terminal cleavage/methylation domain-containing protein
MKRRDSGMTLIELLVSMVMFVFVIAASAQVFTTLMSQYKQQSKIEETQFEGLIGLELLRHDIEHAGYGLPWNLDGATYLEALSSGELKTTYIDRNFNDSSPDNCQHGSEVPPGSFPPAGIRSTNEAELIAGCNSGGSTLNGSDVLVIKSINIATNGAAHKWTRLGKATFSDPQGEKRNGLSGAVFVDNDRVIVITPGNTTERRRSLIRHRTHNVFHTT